MSRRRAHDDSGNALVEFIFAGVLLLIPVAYIALAISYVQRNVYGVSQAAREAGRLYASTGDPATAEQAARLALSDQGMGSGGITIGWSSGGSCAHASAGLPALVPGEVFAVCVTRQITLPGVPSIIGARPGSATGRFVVHVDDYRAAG